MIGTIDTTTAAAKATASSKATSSAQASAFADAMTGQTGATNATRTPTATTRVGGTAAERAKIAANLAAIATQRSKTVYKPTFMSATEARRIYGGGTLADVMRRIRPY